MYSRVKQMNETKNFMNVFEFRKRSLETGSGCALTVFWFLYVEGSSLRPRPQSECQASSGKRKHKLSRKNKPNGKFLLSLCLPLPLDGRRLSDRGQGGEALVPALDLPSGHYLPQLSWFSDMWNSTPLFSI